jgi:hypothetical protein
MNVNINYKGRLYPIEFDSDTTVQQLAEKFMATHKIMREADTEYTLFEDIEFESDPEKGMLPEASNIAAIRKLQADRNNVREHRLPASMLHYLASHWSNLPNSPQRIEPV